MNDLGNRRVIVTGAARGIGAELVRGLVAQRARVVAMDVRDDAGRALVASFSDAHCTYLHCDVSQKREVEASFETAVKELSGLDVLVNAAGRDRPGPAPEDIPEEDWDYLFAIDAKGTFLTNQVACRTMKAQGTGGAIINFGSIAGVRGMHERAAYSAAKGAVHAWTRAAAQAWGRYGITVNAIAPIMATEVAQKFIDSLDAPARAAMEAEAKARIPMGGRMGDPATDLVPFLLFLASPAASYITGQTLAVDGGMMMLGS
ncbi:MAG: SDR family NAD(P)-dependent oxidoreductase [Steroidobacteraceae bacterium]